jgi:hypothetical protein
MTAAQANRDAYGHPGTVSSAVVATSKTIYKDTLVGFDSGGTLEPKDASGNIFAGVAMSGGTAAVRIKIERKGIFEMIMSGAGLGTVGDELYAVDDQTVASSGTHKVGRAVKYANTDKIFIDIGGYC